jgi:hypothetical protein
MARMHPDHGMHYTTSEKANLIKSGFLISVVKIIAVIQTVAFCLEFRFGWAGLIIEYNMGYTCNW